MAPMFDFFKPALESVGIKPREDWDATKRQIHGMACAQVARTNLKPETQAKWRTLGRLTQMNPPAIRFKNNKE